MRLVCVTPATREPVTLTEAKRHLIIDDNDHDAEIESKIAIARSYTEDSTRRALLTSTWDYSLQAWPGCDRFKLPLGNLQSVTSLKWKSETGVETTLVQGTDYLVRTAGDQCGSIVLPYAGTWPTGTLYPVDAITVRYVCGWTSPDLIRPTIRAILLLFLAKIYEGRGEDITGIVTHEDRTISILRPNETLYDEFE